MAKVRRIERASHPFRDCGGPPDQTGRDRSGHCCVSGRLRRAMRAVRCAEADGHRHRDTVHSRVESIALLPGKPVTIGAPRRHAVR